MPTLLITGGAGFIGSNLVRYALAHTADRVVVVDKLTYAGSLLNLEEPRRDPRVTFVRADIADAEAVVRVFDEHRPAAVLNLAAETHVDRSIDGPRPFIDTNIVGTYVLLDTARRFVATLDAAAREAFRFLHVSTDEVYGTLGPSGLFSEDTPYAPNSPYAASKAASDLLARSYWKTHGLPVVITNCCNNYGPYQLPEKLIPLMIANAVEGKPLPVYGQGKQIREWLHVDDHCAGLWRAMTRGARGESYNFGSGEEMSNLALVELLADLVDDELSRARGTTRALIKFVVDRKGHDFRYAIDSSKAKRELAWERSKLLDVKLAETVRWYLANAAWRQAVASEEHARFQAVHYPGVR